MPSIKKRGDTYYVYWYEGGVKKGKAISTDKLATQEYARNLALNLKHKKVGLQQVITLNSFLTEYLNYSKTNKQHNTYIRDTFTINEFQRQFPDIRNVSELSPQIFEKFKESRLQAGIMASSINRELSTLKGLCSKLVEWNYLSINPTRGVKYLPIQHTKLRFFDTNEIKTILGAPETAIKKSVILGLYTGMRGGEVRSLVWDMIDFEKKTITILETKEGKPKYIPISDKLYNYLSKWDKSKNLVIGQECSGNVFSVLSKRFFNSLGLRNCSFHTCRHTFISQAIMAGTDIFTISKICGHASVDQIYNTYGHLTPGHLNNVVNKLPY